MSAKKVVKIRQRRHVFFVVFVFLMVLLYLSYHAVSFLTGEKPTVYTVGEETSLTQSRVYTGLAIRKEEVVRTEAAGIINYYVPASSRVSVGDSVYSLDETGDFSRVASEEGVQHIQNTDLTDLVNEYATDYDGKRFSSVYDLKYELNSRLLLSVSATDLERFADSFINGFHLYTAPATGLVAYYTDGFEDFEETAITAEDFDREDYEKQQLTAMVMKEADRPAYKLITSEAWDIYIPLSDTDAAQMTETKSVRVRFTEADLETTVRFALIHGADGRYYGKLTLTKYMLRYADTRYLKLELLRGEKTGLQVPKSAAAQEELYEIPAAYLTTGGNSDADGFQVLSGGGSGTLARFVPVNVIYRDSENCYVEKSALQQGAILQMPDSSETLTVVKTRQLTGAYQVNRGYAIFKVFEILDESEDYYVVKNGSYNGLAAWDKILLYPTSGINGAFVY